MKEKKKASLVLSILSIIFAFGFPVLSIIFGIFGLVLANSNQKESGLDYKTEKILSIIGMLKSPRGLAIAGFVLSLLGVIVVLFFFMLGAGAALLGA